MSGNVISKPTLILPSLKANTPPINVAGRIRRNVAWFVWPAWGCFPATIVSWVIGGSPIFPLASLGKRPSRRELLDRFA